MDIVVRKLLTKLSALSIFILPECDVVADGPRPSRVYFDASIDGFGSMLEQEKLDSSVRPNTSVSHTTPHSDRH